MEVSGQLCSLAALACTFSWHCIGTGWTPEPVWLLCKTEKSLAPASDWTKVLQLSSQLPGQYTFWAVSVLIAIKTGIVDMLVKLHGTKFTADLFSSAWVVRVCTEGQTVLSICVLHIPHYYASNSALQTCLKIYHFPRKLVQSPGLWDCATGWLVLMFLHVQSGLLDPEHWQLLLQQHSVSIPEDWI